MPLALRHKLVSRGNTILTVYYWATIGTHKRKHIFSADEKLETNCWLEGKIKNSSSKKS